MVCPTSWTNRSLQILWLLQNEALNKKRALQMDTIGRPCDEGSVHTRSGLFGSFFLQQQQQQQQQDQQKQKQKSTKTMNE